MKCVTCGEETSNPKFCSSSCSAKWNNVQRIFDPANDKRTKLAHCKLCSCDVEVNIRTSIKNVYCKQCRDAVYIQKNKIIKDAKYVCKQCGQVKCLRPNVCRRNLLFPSLIKYFGFDESSIGTIRVYEEFERIKNKLVEDYYDNLMSLSDVCKKYKHERPNNMAKLLNSLGIKLRTLSQSLTNAYVNGRINVTTNPKYKHGYHITWNGKKVFYRSSYELDYCKELDEKKIDYKMENLRILYWDSQLLRQRVAIPDFHLIESNTIAEVKSTYTYDKINMNDKVKAYKEHGYNFKLILEHEEVKV